MMTFQIIDDQSFLNLIERTRKFQIDSYETYLRVLFENVMQEMHEFIPSTGFFVLLDDPRAKKFPNQTPELIYIASYGKHTPTIMGKKIPANTGFIGETYTLAKPTIRKEQDHGKLCIDKVNFPHEARNLLSIPLKIEGSVVGVLFGYDKVESVGYTLKDLRLAQIFAGYISTSLQNAIDAKKSKELSKRDDLTGLSNDRFFHEQLEREIIEALDKRHPLSLIFLDLDHFKSVNDQHGHLVGSQTLKEVGHLLKNTVTHEFATLARYGGDEYVIVLPHVTLDEAIETAEKIRTTIKNHFFMIPLSDQESSFVNFKGVLTASIGVSSLQEHVPHSKSPKDSKNLLIKFADQAMYQAKAKGKDCVCVLQPSDVQAF